MDLATFKKRIDTASGKREADLVIDNVNVVNVFTHEVIKGSVGVVDGVFVGMGDYKGKTHYDAKGATMAPGLIDSHVHIESSFGTPYQFARAVLPHGTTTIIADCHEIANVCGVDGISFMLASSEGLPLTVYMMLPSCVPASGFETSGAILNAEHLKPMQSHPRVLGLGEMMNYPGVISGQMDIIEKLQMAEATIVDGHGPGQTGLGLNAYIISGVKTDHECTNVEQMLERIQNGMYIAIREGSAAKNLLGLMGGVNDVTERRCMFCTDDRHPEDIIEQGHIDNNIRVAINNGMDPITAIRLATINTAECYGIRRLGAIAPGYTADFILVDNLKDFNVMQTYKRGVRVKPDWATVMPDKEKVYAKVKGRVNIGNISADDLKIAINQNEAQVIKLKPQDLYTFNQKRTVKTNNGFFAMNTDKDIMPIYVLERHHGTGNIGKGLIEGFGLKNGAIASTVAHDSHNLVVVGDSDRDVMLAIDEIKRIGGGLAIAKEGKLLGSMALDIAGIMSSEKLEVIAKQQDALTKMAYSELHISKDYSPFMTLAFMALTVIPELKLTDKGLFDVNKFELTEV